MRRQRARTHCELTVIESLSVVTIRGFESAEDDQPGSANYLCEAYGMAAVNSAEMLVSCGILGYNCDHAIAWDFDALIASAEVERLRVLAIEKGYQVLAVEEVTEPRAYAADSGTIDLLRHRNGWVLLW